MGSFHDACERAESASYADSGSDFRAPQRTRDLLVRELVDDTQLECLSLAARERVECCRQRGRSSFGIEPRVCGIEIEVVRAKRHAQPLAGPRVNPLALVVSAQEIASDSVEPRKRRAIGFVTKAPEGERRLSEGLGGQLACNVLRGAGREEPMNGIRVSSIELAEGVWVAPCGVDELCVVFQFATQLSGCFDLLFRRPRASFGAASARRPRLTATSRRLRS